MKRALISVSNKTGIVDFARDLVKLDWEIISTGGTAKVLKAAGLKIIPIEKVTGSPEAFDGRMKTISFQIGSALLYDRQNKKHQREAKKLEIKPIDMVVCNLYPFEKANSIENIDVGGPTMIRAAAKNYKSVIVVIDPKDYKRTIELLKSKRNFPQKTRLQLAQKVFKRMSRYDKKIAEYLKNRT
jgi:phosphoribosylaminoimidazolecarboxamide formyltransferase/IMP cyclohydrolase